VYEVTVPVKYDPDDTLEIVTDWEVIYANPVSTNISISFVGWVIGIDIGVILVVEYLSPTGP
jgi:hypothetical protein